MMAEQSCEIQNCLIQRCRPIFDNPSKGTIGWRNTNLHFYAGQDIFGVTQEDNGLGRLCSFVGLGHPLDRTSNWTE